MKFEDESQNLRLRMRVIQVVIVVLLAALGTRLYFLQVVNGAYYAEKAENQRVRRLRSRRSAGRSSTATARFSLTRDRPTTSSSRARR
jgi:cell division protein FtsI/penicillin-binding protein 2